MIGKTACRSSARDQLERGTHVNYLGIPPPGCLFPLVEGHCLSHFSWCRLVGGEGRLPAGSRPGAVGGGTREEEEEEAEPAVAAPGPAAGLPPHMGAPRRPQRRGGPAPGC